MIKKILLSSFILVLISSCAQNYENQKLTKTEKLKFSEEVKLKIPKKDTDARVGIDNKKDIFAASNLL